MRKISLAVLALLQVGCGQADYTYPDTTLKGEYRSVKPAITRNGAIKVEQVINFSCRHCYRAWNELEQLETSYAGRLQVVSLPIVFANGSESATRLYHIAARRRQDRAAMSAIFAAAFDEGKDLREENAVVAVAATLGLRDIYLQEKDAAWVGAAMSEDRRRAARYDLSRTPTWIIDDQWIVKPDADNARLIVDDLLANPR